MFWPGKVKLAKLDSIIARNKKITKSTLFCFYQFHHFRHSRFKALYMLCFTKVYQNIDAAMHNF